MDFYFDTRTENGVLIVELSGNLISTYQSQALLCEMDFHYEQGCTKIIIDLAKMDYMNSTGLNIFINILTHARILNGEVVIVNVPKSINKLLIITKLNNVFTIEDSIEKAMLLLKNEVV